MGPVSWCKLDLSCGPVRCFMEKSKETNVGWVISTGIFQHTVLQQKLKQ